jgi:hypothetical protein
LENADEQRHLSFQGDNKMAKRFYGIDMRGRFVLQRVAGDPAAAPGELWYDTSNTRLRGQAGGAYTIVLDNGGNYANVGVSASNLYTGTVPVARLSGTYNINVTGTARYG